VSSVIPTSAANVEDEEDDDSVVLVLEFHKDQGVHRFAALGIMSSSFASICARPFGS
jgi:hypothetical protein